MNDISRSRFMINPPLSEPKRQRTWESDSSSPDIESLLISDTSPEMSAARKVFEFDLESLAARVSRFRNQDGDSSITHVSTNVEDVVLALSRDPNLPLSLPVDQEKFFIRECYPVYYDLLMECLRSDVLDFISVTGTPGIGKSVFYIYVFDRFRREHPGETIITASFDKDNMLIECVVYKPDEPPEIQETVPMMDGLYLFDGPPTQSPLRRKMICFTSPNQKWFNKNRSNRRHSAIHMPVWTLHELVDANQICGLGIGADAITGRFHFFGGCPRYGLCNSSNEVIIGEKMLAGKLASIDSYEKMGICLRDTTPDDQITHQVFHSVPVISDTVPFVQHRTRNVCSKRARELIYHAIKDKSDVARAELVRSIRLVPELASLRGTMFEDFCTFYLGKGGAFNLSSLDVWEEIRQVVFAKGDYQGMEAGCESVDGVAKHESAVYLFQVTVGKTHPVNAHGILERLKAIGVFEDFCAGRVPVRLVFVLPRSTRGFKRQKIVQPRVLHWGSSVKEMSMREEFVSDLSRLGFKTADDVRRGVASGNLCAIRYQPLLTRFEARVINAPHCEKTNKIPQYTLVLDELETADGTRDSAMEELRLENERLRKRLQELEAQVMPISGA